MTDKQIIIDGVDVSGCPHYKTSDCLISPVWCDQFYNCAYKQLKRQERRCDMWQDIAVDNGEVALKYQQQLDQLKAERDSYIDKYFLESQKVINLKKILIEIKEIATHCIKQDICTTCDNSEKCYIEDEEIPTYDVCKLILQKISEVIA